MLNKTVNVISRLLVFAACALVCVAAKSASVIQPTDMNAAVSLQIEVAEDGAIVGTMRNNTSKKIGDVEVLVEYAWIWAQEFNHPSEELGWSMTYTLPVELTPGASVPLNLSPLHPLQVRDDGHYLISAKVVGYTRYRWVTPSDL